MKKIAIIIRGSVGVGKSTAADGIQKALGSRVSKVTLDDGWAEGEFRYAGDSTRYSDLVSESPILLVELAYGEPAGDVFPGATKNPAEWADILRKDRREIFLFKLSADWETTRKHLARRKQPESDQKAWHARYEEADWKSLPQKLNLQEIEIDTAITPPNMVIDIILATLNKASEKGA